MINYTKKQQVRGYSFKAWKLLRKEIKRNDQKEFQELTRPDSSTVEYSQAQL